MTRLWALLALLGTLSCGEALSSAVNESAMTESGALMLQLVPNYGVQGEEVETHATLPAELSCAGAYLTANLDLGGDIFLRTFRFEEGGADGGSGVCELVLVLIIDGLAEINERRVRIEVASGDVLVQAEAFFHVIRAPQ